MWNRVIVQLGKNIKWEALTLINQDRMCFEALVIVTSQEDLLNVFFYSFSSDASQLSDETTFFDSCEKSIKWGSLWLHNCQKRPQSLHPFRIHTANVNAYLCNKYIHEYLGENICIHIIQMSMLIYVYKHEYLGEIYVYIIQMSMLIYVNIYTRVFRWIYI